MSKSDSQRQVGSAQSPQSRNKVSASKSREQRVRLVLTTVARKGGVASEFAFNRAFKWMSRMAQGSDVDLRTPFFNRGRSKKGLNIPPRSEIISGLTLQPYEDDYLDSLLRSDEFEYDEAANVGPMSMFLPWEKDGPNKVGSVYSDKDVGAQFKESAWEQALDRLQSLVPTNSSPVLSIEQAINGESAGSEADELDGMDTKTNSGAPWFIRPWKPSAEAEPQKVPEIQSAYSYYTARVKELYALMNAPVSESDLPFWFTIAGQRLVQKGPTPYGLKAKRLIIAFPKDEAILWKMITPPIMDIMRELKLSGGVKIMCGWHSTSVIDTEMQRMLQWSEKHGRAVLSGDVSNFDATLPPRIILDVGKILGTWIKGHSRLVENLVYTMVNRAWLITPTQLVTPRPSSLKSGSGCTNLIGSLCNMAIQFYGEEAGLYKIDNLAVLGDDFVIDGPSCSADTTAEAFKHFGMESHPDKQFVHKRSLAYLKRVHYFGRPGGIASVFRTLGSVLSLERLQYHPEDWNDMSYIVRALSQLQNAVFSPWFTELVNYVKSGDKYQLGAEITDPSQILKSAGQSGQEMVAADMRRPWKNQDTRTSFKDWAVNGVIRGEELPRDGMGLFQRVYGKAFSLN